MADTSRATRLKRFKGWTPEHRQAVLKAAGVSREDFRAMSRDQKKKVLDRGIGARRERTQQLDSPEYFLQPLTERTARQQALNSANLVYGGQEQLAGQYGQSIDP